MVSLGHVCATKRVRIYQNRASHVITHVPPHARMSGHNWGNRDFSGNGPDLMVQVDVYVEDNLLKSNIYMSATEPKHDWTAAIGSRSDVLYIPEMGWRIRWVVGAVTVKKSLYRDNNHSVETWRYSSGPVRKLEIMGDGRGNDAGRHTHVKVFFNPYLEVDLIETGDCVLP